MPVGMLPFKLARGVDQGRRSSTTQRSINAQMRHKRALAVAPFTSSGVDGAQPFGGPTAALIRARIGLSATAQAPT